MAICESQRRRSGAGWGSRVSSSKVPGFDLPRLPAALLLWLRSLAFDFIHDYGEMAEHCPKGADGHQHRFGNG